MTVVGVLLASAGAWYFFLRTPSPAATPAPEPTTIAAATPAPTPEPTVEPTVEPTAAPTEEPPAATPTPAPVATPTPAPRSTPTPRPTPATPAPAAPAGDGRALLRQGSLPEASRSFAASLAPGARGRYSLQLLVACAPENVTKAVSAVSSDELYILPVSVKGRACYRLCWGVYDGRPAAEAALSTVPSYFRQGGMTPRVAPLGELLP